MGIRIDALDTTVLPSREHEIPAMKDGLTVKLNVGQVVDIAKDEILGGAPEALDTLNELAAALNDDENFATTVTNELAAKADEADTDTPNLTGKTTPVDADSFRIWDSVGTAFKKLTFANLWTWVKAKIAGEVVTPWVAYTPAITGNTASATKARSRRVGSNLEVEFSITFNSAGSAGTDLAISLGYEGVASNVVIDSYWDTYRPVVGNAGWNVDGAVYLNVLGSGSASGVNIAAGSAGRNSLTPGKGDFVNGTVIAARFSVPIQGWN